MKLLKVGLLFAVCFVWLTAATPARALEAEPLPPKPADSPVLITGYQVAAGKPAYIQLYNDSSSIASLEGWRIEYTAENGGDKLTLPIALGNWLLPKEYAVISLKNSVDKSDAEYEVEADLSLYKATGLRLVPPENYLPYAVKSEFQEGMRYELSKSSAGNYTSTSKHLSAAADVPLYGGGLYVYDETTPLRVVEILANPKSCGPLEKSPNCREFIKIHNASGQSVDLSKYRLRFGYGNENAGITNAVRLDGLLPGGAYHAVQARSDGKPLEITASGGGAWLEDAHGLKLYETTVYDYPDIGDGDYKGFSWALSQKNRRVAVGGRLAWRRE